MPLLRLLFGGAPALESRNFRLFLGARFLFTLGVQMQAVAVGYESYEKTASAMSLGWIGLAQFLPRFIFALAAGQAADRYDRRRIVMLCYSAQIFCSACFLAMSALGLHNMRVVYALLFLAGMSFTFLGPAYQSLLPRTVPQEHLPSAVALSSSNWQLAAIVGPSIGGAVYGLAGAAGAVYASDLFMSICALVFIGGIDIRFPKAERSAIELRELFAGLHFVWERKLILGAITMDLFAVLLGGVTALLPIYARDILHADAEGLGVLRASPAIGALAMGLWLARQPPMQRAGPALFWSVAIYGFATLGFAFSTWFPLSAACLILLGAADMVSVVIRHTLVQINTPDDMRGRVSAVNFVFIGASNQLGEFRAGSFAHLMGAVAAAAFGGVGSLAVVGISAWLFPQLRTLGALDKPVAGAGEEKRSDS
ncbi:MAG: Enterobactin exporter EntS [Myxococcota bacterium]|nr:Enterobactin exporter EntS [Myxococcota bacterium]